MKYLIAIAAFAVLLAAPLHAASDADSEDVSKDQMGLIKADGQTYAIRITSSGHIIGGADKQIDLGSPGRRMRNIYVATDTVSNGQLQISTNAAFNFAHPAASTACAASVTIPVPNRASYIMITSTGGPISMTAIPNLSTATARDGDQLIVFSTTNSVIMTDYNTVLNTGVKLGAATRTLGVFDSIEFEFYASTGAWIEKRFSNVQ